MAFLEENALVTPERAEKMLEFVSHPLWRAYVFCYAGGEDLTTRWVEQAGNRKGEIERFSRLLGEQLTPSGIAAGDGYQLLIGPKSRPFERFSRSK